MKKISLVALLLSFIVFGFSSCKPTPVHPTVQNLSISPETLGQTMDVTFKADQSGNGTITTLTFTIGGKDSTVNNPSLPWSYTASSLNTNDVVSMTAKGTVSNGVIKIFMNGYGANSNFQDADSISMSSSK